MLVTDDRRSPRRADPLTLHHLKLALLPILFGLIIAIPLGIMCARWRWLYPPTLGVANVLYGVPSLALFMLFIPYFGIGSGGQADFTIIIPLTLFSLSVLVPNVVDGLRSVPDPVRQAATAMGFGTLRRLVQVELPIAVPVVIAGARVAAVASHQPGERRRAHRERRPRAAVHRRLLRDFTTPIIVSCVLIIVLALVSDAALLRWALPRGSGLAAHALVSYAEGQLMNLSADPPGTG